MRLENADRLAVLHGWAKRVMLLREGKEAPDPDKRRHIREPLDAEVVLLPLETHNLRPLPRDSMRVVGKDISDSGLAVLCDRTMPHELYFAEISRDLPVLLIRAVWQRQIENQIIEYGFQIIDRYGSFEELREGYLQGN
jgi:hypothetical protein